MIRKFSKCLESFRMNAYCSEYGNCYLSHFNTSSIAFFWSNLGRTKKLFLVQSAAFKNTHALSYFSEHAHHYPKRFKVNEDIFLNLQNYVNNLYTLIKQFSGEKKRKSIFSLEMHFISKFMRDDQTFVCS
jgi:hypothetical protein